MFCSPLPFSPSLRSCSCLAAQPRSSAVFPPFRAFCPSPRAKHQCGLWCQAGKATPSSKKSPLPCVSGRVPVLICNFYAPTAPLPAALPSSTALGRTVLRISRFYLLYDPLDTFFGGFAVAGKVRQKTDDRGLLITGGWQSSFPYFCLSWMFFISPPAWTMLHPVAAVCF